MPTEIGSTEAKIAPVGKTDQALVSFLKKHGLSGDKVLGVMSKLGVDSLYALKTLKEDREGLELIKEEMRGSPAVQIRTVTNQFNAIEVDDIEQAIAEASSPEVESASVKREQLTKAIEKVEALREKVEEATGTELAAVKSDVESEYAAALETIKDVSGADFASASLAAVESKKALTAQLTATINNALAVKELLDGVDKTTRTLARIIRQQDMLCGFLISPGETTRKVAELVKLPENPDQMSRDPGTQKAMTLTYKGSEAKSFAASSAQQSSSSLATAAQASGAGFVGSGVAAVSAAASYADSQRASTESQKFESQSRASCGEIHYIYVPKESVQFNKRELHLSEDAKERLKLIATLPEDQQTTEIMRFYDEYGSHFFLQSSLGGRYQFTAKGESYSETGKGLLISAVAQTTNWAASASGSYAGMGGAAEAAASVKGQQSVAAAQGDRFALDFDSAKVDVSTEVLGGAGLAPRDVWAQSLRYNSTWAVIDRDQPIGVWELVRLDGSLSSDIKNLAPVLEKVWVREVYRNAVQRSYPALYNYLQSNPAIDTCSSLDTAVKQQSLEPPLDIVVAMATSGSAEHPRAVAVSNDKGLKLIGGGAIVDYGQGPGNLLTGSYPEGKAWVASSKSHRHSSPATVTAYAIYLSDPNNLWDVKMVSATTQERSNRPEVTAQLPAGYALTGGGALVDWGGPGVMLTACCPQEIDGTYTGWAARAKAHMEQDSGNATAWVFGIRLKNGDEPTPSTVDQYAAQSMGPTLEHGAPPDEVVVGGGAAVTWRGPGGLLTRSGLSPDFRKWTAQAKAHEEADTLDLTMWVISRKGRLTTV
jgi:hypothetical protein